MLKAKGAERCGAGPESWPVCQRQLETEGDEGGKLVPGRGCMKAPRDSNEGGSAGVGGKWIKVR